MTDKTNSPVTGCVECDANVTHGIDADCAVCGYTINHCDCGRHISQSLTACAMCAEAGPLDDVQL